MNLPALFCNDAIRIFGPSDPLPRLPDEQPIPLHTSSATEKNKRVDRTLVIKIPWQAGKRNVWKKPTAFNFIGGEYG
jgi:hypothetical protein